MIRSVSTSSAVPVAGVDAAEGDERPDHQAGAHEQHHGERDLGDDQRAAEAMALAAVAGGPPAVLERRDARSRELDDRNEPEQHAGEPAISRA